MPTYKAPLREYRFLLNELLDFSQYADLPGFADAPADLVDAILEEAAKLTEEVLLPLNQVGDREGCKLENGVVTTPTGFKEAYKTLVDGGWPALVADTAYGGQGLPNALGVIFNEMVSSANMAFGMYPGLSHGAYSALSQHGTDEQKKKYLPKLVTGEWTGTMNLTEPHCGTDLGLLRTKAVPVGDGSFKISGQKIFISAGEHDLADNILHLVLARIEGAPAGVKGISLFLVPKFLVNDDGSLGNRNGVSCGSLEEKMGIHGNATCVLNYDEAIGWLVGEEHKGLRAMFTMMNEARLGVGLQGLSQSEAAYQNAVIYALERLQGRSLTGPKAADKPADPLIVHPDIRRMLLDIKSFNEGARALLVWTALHGDLSHRSDDEKTREFGDDMMSLLTPVLKGYFTDRGFMNAVDAQQVYGGHGYIDEWGMGQFVRDARIAMIYEGANGVQALDLVGRKLAQNGGRGVFAFFKEIDGFIAANEGDEKLKPFVEPLARARKDLEAATMWFMENALQNADHAGAGSTPYMHLFGVTGLAYMWAKMARVSNDKLANLNGEDKAFYETKIKTGRYYMEHVVPETATHLARIRHGADPMMALAANEF
ncbi:MAG: acyl-CoA dehydrogenase C-terminal domain-containing protein [Parvibaculum sp.]|uniref:acyl-CoA dehydrogenase C-terminal domain-containing protein n=1 Tax=Parvibaculum sp. TaxID=2024848 RepID=UPI002730DE73|nr:acyl-CoA dehydrogenase C-terminal domain-containing protein [Parvibaculum sp.]MDP1626496.1 acyl-CoA dehydrogenase C-terminal domain-containing protein [Parvibaculum sp.]MDP2150418.1 acyl-CoA dehydrogenase C-terminal domain-containing protein [Parvibaculum sp.]